MNQENEKIVDTWRAFLLLLPFIILINILSIYTWGYGVQSFFILFAIALWTAFGCLIPFRIMPSTRIIHTVIVIWISLFIILSFCTRQFILLNDVIKFPSSKVLIVDMAENNRVASNRFFKYKQNPYSERCQFDEKDISGLPHVSVDSKGTNIYGIPYRYGYTYFPMMFFAYTPVNMVIQNANSIRITNAIMYILLIAGLFWMGQRSFKDKKKQYLTGFLSVLLLCAIIMWGSEIFILGITDIVISVFLLYGMILLSYRREILAGILIGLAISCKILPAPLVFVFISIWMWKKGLRVWRFVIPALATATVIILPFIIWNPYNFLSATVLFYLSLHSLGDTTSLWTLLPEAVKGPFQFLGPLLVICCFIYAIKFHNKKLFFPAKMAFISYVLWVACYKITHLNFIWGIYSLGVYAFAAEAVDSSGKDSNE